MKRILTSIVLVSLTTFPIAHGFAHANIHSHVEESHSLHSDNHSHLEHLYHTVDSNQDHQENLHKHIDSACLRLSRQRELGHEIFTQQFYVSETALLYDFYFYDIRKPAQYTQTTFYPNQPFLSSNQPLLI